jgi:hypothetical protein
VDSQEGPDAGWTGNHFVLPGLETTKLAYDEITTRSCVDVHLHSTVIDATQDEHGRVRDILVNSRGGKRTDHRPGGVAPDAGLPPEAYRRFMRQSPVTFRDQPPAVLPGKEDGDKIRSALQAPRSQANSAWVLGDLAKRVPAAPEPPDLHHPERTGKRRPPGTHSGGYRSPVGLVPCASTWPDAPAGGSCGRHCVSICNRQGRALCDQVAADHRKADGLRIGYDSLNSAFPEAEIVAAGVSSKAEKRYSS